MKKSKIIIPALGVLALSTAASITGTVAWFTANRTATITAGNFAVVKTGGDLSVTLGSGVGVAAGNIDNSTKTISGLAGSLTDASFNHTNAKVVVPNSGKTKVLEAVALGDGQFANKMVRDTNIYSAITWDMTFSVTFPSTTANLLDLGLFLDTNHAETYAHEVVSVEIGDSLAGLYNNVACTGDPIDSGTADATGTYYRKVPTATGLGFRLAFVPTNIASSGTLTTNIGYTKVWAPNRTWNATQASSQTAYVSAATGADLPADIQHATNYDHNTSKLSYDTSEYALGAATAGADAGSQKVLMDSANKTAIPNDSVKTATNALSDCPNYLGIFKAESGVTISMTFTCVAWYEGTDAMITNAGAELGLQTMATSLHFGVTDLANPS